MKKSLIIVNSFKENAHSLAEEIQEFLESKNVSVNQFVYDGKNVSDEDLKKVTENCDFVITLGGDGTVLFASRICSQTGVPVFPVNLGEFGFIAGIQTDEWKTELNSFLENKNSVTMRSLVYAEIIRNGKKIFSTLGMNDIIISSSISVKIINVDVSYKNASLGKFKADGIIVATATGSTAYSAASGGPIVDPTLDVLVLTPVNSFSLSARPLILNPKDELSITVLPSRSSLQLTADGQITCMLEEGDVVKLGMSENKVKLVCSSQEKFFAALRSKLNWSGGPCA